MQIRDPLGCGICLDSRVIPQGTRPRNNPDPATHGFSQISSQKAYDADWETRPFHDTALDYLIYVASRKDFVFRDTLSAEKQDEIIKSWRERKN